MTDRFYRQALTVGFEYPVLFTRGVFNPANRILADALTRDRDTETARAVVYVDSGVAAGHAGLDRRIADYFAAGNGRMELAARPEILPGGEAVKNNLARVEELVSRFRELALCRHSYVLAVGGGALLDAVGFAAALFHRGLRIVRLPTTVLAQNDVGVGVKNAMNVGDAKNLVGTFSPPWAVINDFDFLATLDLQNWINGIAEAFKVAIIRDRTFFDFLCAHTDELCERDPDAMEHLIVRCAELHLEHIRKSGDPFEFGRARPLDFGHWSAHKLEAMSGYKIGHGDAVATGIAIDSLYAAANGWITEEEANGIVRALRGVGFNLWHDVLDTRAPDGSFEVLAGIESFRQHLGGRLYITFPNGIGRKKEVCEIDEETMTACIGRLREHAAS